MKKAQVNDVVQFNEENDWYGSLAIVTEVSTWGIVCYLEVPTKGKAYYRAPHGDYEVIGKAAFGLPTTHH